MPNPAAHGHFVEHSGFEAFLGVVLFLLGALLIWDAFDGRGKKLPWPAGAILPW